MCPIVVCRLSHAVLRNQERESVADVQPCKELVESVWVDLPSQIIKQAMWLIPTSEVLGKGASDVLGQQRGG